MSAYLESPHLEIAWQRISGRSESHSPFALLSQTELGEYLNLKIPKRRSDWLAGRIACKKAVQKLLRRKGAAPQLELSGIVLEASNGRRPQVNVNHLHVSLSHSGEWTCAAVCENEPSLMGIGIDLEKIVEPDWDVLPIAFSLEEQKQIKKENRRYSQFWTAKEAVLKALGIGLSVDLRELEVEQEEIDLRFSPRYSQVYFRGQRYRVKGLQLQGYFLSTCSIHQ